MVRTPAHSRSGRSSGYRPRFRFKRMSNRLALLGPVCLTSSSRNASLRRASQSRRLALLALIASSPGESISRDRLLGLLWTERDERTARHLLADSLYVLRRSLGDAAIIAAGETLPFA